MRLTFVPIHVFRETPAVTFFDASVEGSNGTDVVAHHGVAISPHDDDRIPWSGESLDAVIFSSVTCPEFVPDVLNLKRHI